MINHFKKKVSTMNGQGMTNKTIYSLLGLTKANFYKYKRSPSSIPPSVHSHAKSIQSAQIRMTSVQTTIKVYDKYYGENDMLPYNGKYNAFHIEEKRTPYKFSKAAGLNTSKKEIDIIENYDKIGKKYNSKKVVVVARRIKSRFFNYTSTQVERGELVTSDKPVITRSEIYRGLSEKEVQELRDHFSLTNEEKKEMISNSRNKNEKSDKEFWNARKNTR